MQITREQFLRGCEAINSYRALVHTVHDAMSAADCEPMNGLGGDAICSELTRQLEERCNDPSSKYGSLIEYMLYDCGGPIIIADGKIDHDDGSEWMVNTPELLWTYWQETGSGPFAKAEA